MKRRDLLKTGAKGAAVAIIAPAVTRAAAAATMIHRGRYRLSAGSEQAYSARAVELVQRSTVIDMLAPLWLSLPRLKKMLMNPENFNAEDFAPYKASGINVFHIADGIEGPDA
jgi:membrane dipeptidase